MYIKKLTSLVLVFAFSFLFMSTSYAAPGGLKQDTKRIAVEDVGEIEKVIQEQKDRGWNFTGMTEEEIKKNDY